MVKDSGDTFQDKERLRQEVRRLGAIVRLRNQMTLWLRGGRFLQPTSLGETVAVGIKAGRMTGKVTGINMARIMARYSQLCRSR